MNIVLLVPDLDVNGRQIRNCDVHCEIVATRFPDSRFTRVPSRQQQDGGSQRTQHVRQKAGLCAGHQRRRLGGMRALRTLSLSAAAERVDLSHLPALCCRFQLCLQYYQDEFLELACSCPAVVCCRCSPTQKAAVVTLIQRHTHKRTAAVGDGGNDVSMIQAADAGTQTGRFSEGLLE